MNHSNFSFRSLSVTLMALFLLAMPAVLSAHPGHHHPDEGDEFAATSSLVEGLKHPVTGLDHLLAALAVGWVCAMLGKTRGTPAATTFIIALIAGSVAGRAGFVIPGLEAALGISVIALGLFIASGHVARAGWFVPVLMAIGFVHGSAHGSEGPGGSAALIFGVGFVLSTVAILASGAGLRVLVDRSRPLRRLAGGALTAAGAFFLWQAAA
ncbi:MAG: HupE/UreJ family protein [Verrucomicrobiales bacterium]